MTSLPILRLITRLNIGGPAIQALMLTKELRPEFDTILAAGCAPKEEGQLSDPDVDVVPIHLVRAVRPCSDLLAYRQIGRLIKAHRPNLIHTHMAKAGALGRLAAHASPTRPRLIHTFHGHVLDGYFAPPIREGLIAAERFLARRTDILVAVSAQIREDLLRLGIGRPERWRVVHLGFDLSPFASVGGRTGAVRDPLGLDAEVPLVGVLGRLAPVKGHSLLLDALLHLPDVHLAIVGDGELRGQLMEQSSAPELRNRVHFMGWRHDIPQVLADLDVVALSSINEGTPVTLIEALAAARPVVATEVGGVATVVRHGVDGLLVRSRDPLEFADHLAQLISDAALRESFGLSGRARVVKVFSKERLLSDIRLLYREVLES